MKQKVLFGNYDSFEDFSLILSRYTLEEPEAKTEYIDIEGADGELDITEYFGFVPFKSRKATFEFQTKLKGQDFYDMFETISNAINGKRLNIIIYRDEYFYLDGRIKMNEYKSNEKIGSVIIEATCQPYKMEVRETLYTFTLTGGTIEATLTNLKKYVSPKVDVVATAGNNVNITFNNETFSLSNGSWTIPELVLKEGNNIITLSGVGTITFSYRKGKL